MKKIVFLFLMLFNVTSILTDGKIGLGIQQVNAQRMANELDEVIVEGYYPEDNWWEDNGDLWEEEDPIEEEDDDDNWNNPEYNEDSEILNPGTSNNQENGELEDCSDVNFAPAKTATKNAYDMFVKSAPCVVGDIDFYGYDKFKELVSGNPNSEYSSAIYDLTDSYGTIALSNPEEGSNNLSEIVYIPGNNLVGAIHNHPDGSTLSPLDIRTLVNMRDGSPNMKTMMTWNYQTNSLYCATITDYSKAKAFMNKYGSEIDMETHGWVNDGEIKKFIDDSNYQFNGISDKNLQDTYKLASVFSEFDAGITIVKISNTKSADDLSSSQSYTAYKTRAGSSNKIFAVKCD